MKSDSLHSVQMAILAKLRTSPALMYTRMKPNSRMGNNQFDWHLKQLQKRGLVQYDTDGYALTLAGKQYVANLDVPTIVMDEQPKVRAWLVCTRGESSETEYLFCTRKKHPFYGCQGLPAGTVRRGETIVEAAQRELSQECGLVGKARIIHVQHYIIKTPAADLLEDQLMFLCLVQNPQGTLQNSTTADYEWISESRVSEWLMRPLGTGEEIHMALKQAKEAEERGLCIDEQVVTTTVF